MVVVRRSRVRVPSLTFTRKVAICRPLAENPAMPEDQHPGVGLWRSLGFEVLATVPEGVDHPVKGYVGLHIMHRRL
jgi:hypothetical protein